MFRVTFIAPLHFIEHIKSYFKSEENVLWRKYNFMTKMISFQVRVEDIT
jgi:hypothetical protein